MSKSYLGEKRVCWFTGDDLSWEAQQAPHKAAGQQLWFSQLASICHSELMPSDDITHPPALSLDLPYQSPIQAVSWGYFSQYRFSSYVTQSFSQHRGSISGTSRRIQKLEVNTARGTA